MSLENTIEDVYPLSPLQQGILFDYIYDTSSPMYHEQSYYRAELPVDTLLVQKCLDLLAARHTVLRTSFVYEGFEKPLQVVLRERAIQFRVVELDHTLSEQEAEELINSIRSAEAGHRYDLTRDALMRVVLIRTGLGWYELVWTFHHIIMDGWCVNILAAEFKQLMKDMTENGRPTLGPPLPYSRFIRWVEETDKEASMGFWKNYLHDYHHGGSFASENIPQASRKNMVCTFSLGSDLVQSIRSGCETLNLLPSVYFRVVWGVLLSRFMDTQDIVFGTILAGRPPEIPGIENMVGLCINQVPFRIRYAGSDSFQEVLWQAQQSFFACEKHQYIAVAQALPGTAAYYNNTFLYQHVPDTGGSHTPDRVMISNIDESFRQDLFIRVSSASSGAVELLFNGNVYPEPIIHQLALNFIKFAQQSAHDPQALMQEFIINEGDKHRLFWMQQFSEEVLPLQLPFDLSQFPEQGQPSSISFQPQAVSAGFPVLLSALHALLYRYTGQDDIVTGIALNIPAGPKVLPLRHRLKADASFVVLAEEMAARLEEVSAHADYVYKQPLLQVMACHADGMQPEPSPWMQLSADAHGVMPALMFMFSEIHGKLQVIIAYDDALFSQAAIHRMHGHFVNLLKAFDQDGGTPISSLQLLSEAEEHQLLYEFNRPPVDYPADKTLHGVFEEVVKADPGRKALAGRERNLTYGELDAQSNRLAHHLLHTLHLQRGEIVALVMDPTELSIIALLAIMKAGGVYLPIDPAYPAGRKSFILSDASVRIILTESAYLFDLPDHRGALVAVDIELPGFDTPVHDAGAGVQGTDLAYVIYTSGSTGLPKGVLIEHHGCVNMTLDAIERYDVRKDDRMLQFASLAFDTSISEIFMSLLAGATLVLPGRSLLNHTGKFVDFMRAQNISVVTLPPAYLRLLDPASLIFLRTIITAGEKAYPADALAYCQFLEYFNGYGPTECSVCATIHKVTEADRHARSISIGTSMVNTSVLIMDNHGQLAPIGVEGEICITGVQLARGYLNRPALTAEKFVWRTIGGQLQRVYRTGDTGRYDSDGKLEYIGRIDHQVKIRGYRIETGEIENRLLQVDGISAAAVLVKETVEGDKSLLAFIVSQHVDPVQARQQLQQWLPDFMVPAVIYTIDKVPVTVNGKVDRKALLALVSGPAEKDSYRAPVTAVEESLVRIWEEVLGISGIGTRDDFFSIGGHSLKAIQIVSRVNRELGVRLEIREVFTFPTIEALAKVIEPARQQQHQAIPKVDIQADYALSHGQRRLWVLDQMEPGQAAYNIPGSFVFEGRIDVEALRLAFEQLIDRHEILRTIFIEVNGEPRQKILSMEEQGFRLAFTDLRENPDREEVARQLAAAEDSHAFSLSTGPLLRAQLIQLEDERYLFLFTMHHIISDGWSMEVLARQVLGMYEARTPSEGGPSEVGRFPSEVEGERIQYKDYAAWQNNLLQSEAIEEHRNYWLQQFQSGVPVLDLPSDRPRPVQKTFAGGEVMALLDEETVKGLKQLGNEQGASLFITLLACVHALLHRYTGQQEIVTGTTVAGRDHPDLEDQLGFYVNTLALKNEVDSAQSFEYFLRQTRDRILESYRHQIYPFDKLVDELQLERDMSRSPLFDVLVELINTTGEAASEAWTGMDVRPYEVASGISKFDLSFRFLEQGAQVVMILEYNSDLFDRERVVRMAEHVKNLLQVVIEEPGTQIGRIGYVGDEERFLMGAWNETGALFAGKTLVDLYDEQVRRTPDAVAVQFGDATFTYDHIHRQANNLAAYLRSQHHIQPGDVIAISAQRSERLIIGVLGILKSGGVLLPIDSNYPKERKRHILQDAGAKVLLTESYDVFEIDYFSGALFTLDLELPMLPAFEGELQNINTLDDTAYLLYTSGSTGTPKGVAISHDSISNYIQWANAYYFNNDAKYPFAFFTSLSFDLTLTSLFTPLLRGDVIHVQPELDLIDVLQAIFREDSSTRAVKLTPSHVQVLSGMDIKQSNIEIAILGGEALTSEHVRILRSLNASMRIFNEYGPTETTVGCVVHEVGQATETSIPIGRPIANTKLYVLDEHMQLQPIGFKGELWIGGAGVAKGYVNNEALNEQKFKVFNIERVYRSGDIVRYREDGILEYFGRKDEQVKLRGYRIELSEIEIALLKLSNVKQAAVILKDQQLAAFVTSEEQIQPESIKEQLLAWLPSYMVPSSIMQLDAIPLTSNGKADRKALESLHVNTQTQTYKAPSTPIEQTLANIWQEVLGTEQIGVHDNFFEAGGHSLRAVQIVSRIHRELGVKIELREIFAHPTIESLAILVNQQTSAAYEQIHPIAEQPYYELSHAQRRLWILAQLEGTNTAYNMPGAYVFEGAVDRQAMEKAFEALIARHEILRTVFTEIDGSPMQQVLPIHQQNFRLQYTDLRGDASRESTARSMADEEANKPFDLSAGPLLRAHLLQTEDERYIFLFTMHHIISDGWSMEVLTREVLSLYESFSKGEQPSLPPLRIQYKDYAAWQQTMLQADAANSHRNYWMQQFSGELPVLDLPADFPRPKVRQHTGEYISRVFDTMVSNRLTDLARAHQVSDFMILLALVKTLFHRYTGQTDFIVGVPVAGREHTDLENQIGIYVNTVPIRTRFNMHDSFLQVLQAVREQTMNGYAHQLYPFDRMVEELNIRRDLSRSPVFDVMVNNPEISLPSAADDISITASDYEVNFKNSKFDMSFYFIREDGQLAAGIQYDSALYHPQRIKNLLEHLENLAKAVVESAGHQSISKLQFISAEEMIAFTGTAASPGKNTQPSLVHEKVSLQDTDAIALVHRGRQYTFGELEDASNRLAHHLIGLGLQHGEAIGIFMANSPQLVISMLAIMKAGGIFVTIDPQYPAARQEYMLEDAGCRMVCADSALPAGLEKRMFIIDIEKDKHIIASASKQKPEKNISFDDGCYIMYTSGSTGYPKGVLCSHGSISVSLNAIREEYALEQYTQYILAASVSFDPSLRHIFMPLMLGRTLHVVDNSKDTATLAAYICEHHIEVLFSIPTMLQLLLEEWAGHSPEHAPSLKLVSSGSEVLPVALVEALYATLGNDLIINNLYGPTEVCMGATHYRVPRQPKQGNIIGLPFRHNKVYIVDSNMQLMPAGCKGEICISGQGVKMGYINQPELTAEKFITDPFDQTARQRMYKTGDLGMLRFDGHVEYLGRMDAQQKVRGYRIEPQEIESVMIQSGLVKQAAVAPRNDHAGQVSLAAYFIPMGNFGIEEVKSYLKSRLPDYMMPAAFVEVAEMPLTASGKINRNALPGLHPLLPVTSEQDAPRTAVEKLIETVWREVLGVPGLGRNSNFFEWGGDSFKALQSVALLRRHGYSIQLIDVFTCQTIRELAPVIKKRKQGAAGDQSLPAKPKPSSKISWRDHVIALNESRSGELLFIIPGTGGKSEGFHEFAQAMEETYKVYGLHMMGTQRGEKPLRNIRAIASQNIRWMKKIQPQGPYRLMGHSFGAHVVYEMARQLELANEAVDFVAVLDSKAGLNRILTSRKDKQEFVLKLAGDYFESFDIIKPPYPEWVTELRQELAQKPVREAAGFLAGFLKQKLEGRNRLIDLVSRLINVRIYNAHMRYYPGAKIHSEMIVFRAEMSEWRKMDESLGWHRYASNVKICRVTGNHHDMVYRDHAKMMARYLRGRKNAALELSY
jgi:amino acid adenylation domain-containing protein